VTTEGKLLVSSAEKAAAEGNLKSPKKLKGFWAQMCAKAAFSVQFATGESSPSVVSSA
jgi:hypothetical protein